MPFFTLLNKFWGLSLIFWGWTLRVAWGILVVVMVEQSHQRDKEAWNEKHINQFGSGRCRAL